MLEKKMINNKERNNLSHKKKKKPPYTGILFLLPATLFCVVLLAYPFIRTLKLSFYKWNGFSKGKFIGLTNYSQLFEDDIFIRGIKNSLTMGFFSAGVSVFIGLLIAWMLLYTNRKEGVIYRLALFSPSIIPGAITALLFSFMYSPEMGLINNLLEAVGLDHMKQAWLTNSKTIIPSIILVMIWKTYGLTMMLCYAGFQNIPKSLIESARINGAKDGTIFFKIIVPLIRPVLQLCIIFSLMGGVKIYDTVMILTKGGPAYKSVVVPMWIVTNGFNFNKFGYASAMSILFAIMVLIITGISRKIFGGESYEY